ncbi:MAG: ChaN family lipoprotein [Cyanobacteria bacterium J06649_5]
MLTRDRLSFQWTTLSAWTLAVPLVLYGLTGCTINPQSIERSTQESTQKLDKQINPQPAVLANQPIGANATAKLARSSEDNPDVLQAIIQGDQSAGEVNSSPAQVVYLAENHNSAADHAAQLEIVQSLAEAGDIAIALEMFQRPFQAPLDAYLAGEITEAELVEQSEYETRWGFDWELYAPIIRYAKAQSIPLIALNTPAEVTRKVAREGLAGLSGEDLEHIPPIAEVDTSNVAHRKWVGEVFNAHGGAGHSLNFENFYAAQVLWDETMAARIATQLDAEPNRRVVVLAGEGHVVYGHGIPSRVERRLPEVTQASVQLVAPEEDAEAGVTDFVWITGQ